MSEDMRSLEEYIQCFLDSLSVCISGNTKDFVVIFLTRLFQ